MCAEDYQRLAQDFIDALNDGDWDRCGEVLAPEVVLEERTIESRTTTSVALVARLQEIRDAAPDIRISVDSWVATAGGFVAGEVMWTRDALEVDGAVSGMIFLSFEADRLRSIHELHAPLPKRLYCSICLRPPPGRVELERPLMR